MRPRLITLGVDGLDWALLNTWAAEGHLPVLSALLKQSNALIFGESNRALPGSIWTDMATGCSAAVHGFVHEEQLRTGSYRVERVDASRVAVAPFYKTLSDAGIRCALVDFPIDYPIDGFNGIQIVDWATEFKLWRFETRPKSLAAVIETKYGRHPLTDYPGTRNSLSGLITLERQLTEGLEIKRRFAAALLQEHQHDFIFVGFGELHKAGHFFWRFHDRGHPEFTDLEPALVDSLRAMYVKMDRALGTLLEQLGSEDDLIIVTDRGMYADHRGDHLIDPILSKLGLAVQRAAPTIAPQPETSRSRQFVAGPLIKACRWIARRVLSDTLREALLPFYRSTIGAAPPLDWRSTRVFRLPSVGNSYLRINLAGREPQGIVSPGTEYDALLCDIAAQFRALLDPESGERVVEDVYFPAAQFSGPRARDLPDVAIVWNPRRPIDAIASDTIGTISGKQQSDRSGNHRPEGFALLHGPSFAPGTGEYQADARQLAPLILRRFGVDAPRHYEMPAPEHIIKASCAQTSSLTPA